MQLFCQSSNSCSQFGQLRGLIPYCCCWVPKSCLTLCDPHELQHTRLLCPLLSPGVCSDSCALSWWCYLSIKSAHWRKLRKCGKRWKRIKITCLHNPVRTLFSTFEFIPTLEIGVQLGITCISMKSVVRVCFPISSAHHTPPSWMNSVSDLVYS